MLPRHWRYGRWTGGVTGRSAALLDGEDHQSTMPRKQVLHDGKLKRYATNLGPTTVEVEARLEDGSSPVLGASSQPWVEHH